PTRKPPAAFVMPKAVHQAVEFLTGEGSLARVGIALSLAGLAFLVKYGVDQGWLSEVVRVALATLAGGILLSLGRRVKARPGLSQVLLGGGVGALYVAVFAAHVFYGLIPFLLALVLASVVTVLCFYLSLGHDSPTLASIAVTAGLSTPFLLSSGVGSTVALAVYLLLVQVAAGAIFRERRWAFVHVLAAGVSIAALMAAAWPLATDGAFADKLAVQGAVMAAWLIFGILPVLVRTDEVGRRQTVGQIVLSWLPALVPLGIWVLIARTWDLRMGDDGWVACGMAAMYGAAVVVGRFSGGFSDSPTGGRIQASAGGLLAATAVLGVVGIISTTDGEGAGLILVLAAAFQLFEHRGEIAAAGWISRALVVIGGLIVMLRFAIGSQHSWEVSGYDLLGLVSVALVAGWSAQARLTRLILWIISLFYLEREFRYLGEMSDSAPGLATGAWAAFAIGLLAASFRTRSLDLRYAGMATVGLVVIKLVFYDLEQMDPLWRILVFLGIGIVLLATSYLFPTLWQPEEGQPEEGEPDPGQLE
ncbi:MAG: putative membrane protein, partial [Thalassolituus oleivorans]